MLLTYYSRQITIRELEDHCRSKICSFILFWGDFFHSNPIGPLRGGGSSHCPFFVSGSGGIRTHVLLITMQTLYGYPISIPQLTTCLIQCMYNIPVPIEIGLNLQWNHSTTNSENLTSYEILSFCRCSRPILYHTMSYTDMVYHPFIIFTYSL